MVKILSFDVGIKNLAYCLIEFTDNENKILDWGIINMMDKFTADTLKCSVSKKGSLCGCDAINFVDIDGKQIGFCNKKTCQTILTTNYGKKEIKKLKKITTKTISLLDISKEMIVQLSQNENMLTADLVVIENQPVLKNPSMKSIQMVLYTYFVINGCVNGSIKDIIMFNAGRKLEVYNGPEIELKEGIKKGSYAERKYLSIEYTLNLIKEDNSMYEFFTKHKKKDDLADSYLQCLTYYKKNKPNA